MDLQDVELRNVTYRQFTELGRAPSVAEIAQATGWTTDAVRSGWRRLHDQHALVLEAGTDKIRMANPFSAVPTAYRVFTAGRLWFANCAWDAIGVCAALETDGQIDTVCADCLEPLAIRVQNQQVNHRDLVFHCLVSAMHWWDDIVFT